jgi:hypothetical protein
MSPGFNLTGSTRAPTYINVPIYLNHIHTETLREYPLPSTVQYMVWLFHVVATTIHGMKNSPTWTCLAHGAPLSALTTPMFKGVMGRLRLLVTYGQPTSAKRTMDLPF